MQQPEKSCYPNSFFTKEVSVQYSGTNGASAPVVKLTRLLTLHDTQSGPQIAGFTLLECGDEAVSDDQREKAKSVAFLTFGNGAGCTGFLIAPGLVVTNAHCVDSSTSFSHAKSTRGSPCNDANIKFDFNVLPGSAGGELPAQVACVEASRDRDSEVGLLKFLPDDTAKHRPVLKISPAPP
jgi:hypothetical protein